MDRSPMKAVSELVKIRNGKIASSARNATLPGQTEGVVAPQPQGRFAQHRPRGRASRCRAAGPRDSR